MNTNSIYIVGKYLLLALLIFTGFACEDTIYGNSG